MAYNLASNTGISDELFNIDNRVIFLDSEIRKRHQERATLLQEINAINSHGQLPQEILSLIFIYTCPPTDFSTRTFESEDPASSWILGIYPDKSNVERNGSYFPIVLGSVSHYWRQIAWSTPDIWRTMVVEVRRRTARNHASLLQLYLQNSKPLPLGLEVDFRREQKFGHKPYRSHSSRNLVHLGLQPFSNVLLKPDHAARYAVLRLIAPPYEWLPCISKFPPSVELSLGWPSSFCNKMPTDLDLLTITPPISPNLRTLRIHNLPRVLFPSPFPTITHIDLARVALRICLDILARCPSLQRCRLYRPLPDLPTKSLLEPITLPRLQVLEWSIDEHPNSYTPSSCICTPSLRHLKWDTYTSKYIPLFIDFLRHTPPTMTSLHLTANIIELVDRDTWLSIFSISSHLQYLYTEDIYEPCRILNLFRALTPDYDTPDLTTLLPHLCAVYLILDKRSCDSMKPGETLVFINELVTMVGLRREAGQNDPLRIDFNVTFRWPEQTETLTNEIVHAIAHDGLDLDIRQRGRVIQWLEVVKERARELDMLTD